MLSDSCTRSRRFSWPRRHPMTPWSLPERPWVLHSAFEHGHLTERWIGLQAENAERFESRLLARRVDSDTATSPRWLVPNDRIDRHLAYWGSWPLPSLASVWLSRPFRADPPAVIHAHYGVWASRLPPLARRLGAQLVASFYGYDATERKIIKSRFWRRAYARLFAAAGAVIAEGPAMATRIEDLGCPAEKLHVVPLPA